MAETLLFRLINQGNRTLDDPRHSITARVSVGAEIGTCVSCAFDGGFTSSFTHTLGEQPACSVGEAEKEKPGRSVTVRLIHHSIPLLLIVSCAFTRKHKFNQMTAHPQPLERNRPQCARENEQYNPIKSEEVQIV